MAKTDYDPHVFEVHPERLSADRLSFEFGRTGLVVMCALIAFVAGYVGGDVQNIKSWTILVERIPLLAVALVVTAALLRVIDLLSLRRRMMAQINISRAHSNEFLQYLESKFPGIAERAREIDAEALVNRALQQKGRAETSNSFTSKLGA